MVFAIRGRARFFAPGDVGDEFLVDELLVVIGVTREAREAPVKKASTGHVCVARVRPMNCVSVLSRTGPRQRGQEVARG